MLTDKKLKLVIVEHCPTLKKKYHFGWDTTFEDFVKHNFKSGFSYSAEANKEVEHFFLNLLIPQEDLLAITRLCLDADQSVFQMITEDILLNLEYFYIRSLEGIHHCKNLQRLDLNAMTHQVDLQPLTGLKKIEAISIDYYNAKNYGALLDVESLKELEIRNWHSFSKADQQELRGVLRALIDKNAMLTFTPQANWQGD